MKQPIVFAPDLKTNKFRHFRVPPEVYRYITLLEAFVRLEGYTPRGKFLMKYPWLAPSDAGKPKQALEDTNAK